MYINDIEEVVSDELNLIAKIIILKEKGFIYINTEDEFIDINIFINYFDNIINRDYYSIFNLYNILYVFNSIPVINFIITADITAVILLADSIALN